MVTFVTVQPLGSQANVVRMTVMLHVQRVSAETTKVTYCFFFREKGNNNSDITSITYQD